MSAAGLELLTREKKSKILPMNYFFSPYFVSGPKLYVLGLMSGTSLDGVDVCLSRLHWNQNLCYEMIGFETFPMPDGLRQKLLCNMQPESSRVDQLCALNVQLGHWFAESILAFLRHEKLTPETIDLIGSHGQTLFHLPPGTGEVSASLQLGDAAVMATLTGITTITDFRLADMAAGGQGAPLVPWLDALIFQHLETPICLQNIGGIGNLTWLGPENQILAFDTGPGNLLIDSLARHFSQGVQLRDHQGAWAAQGMVSQTLLDLALRHPFFTQAPPKSTGREIFGEAYTQWFLQKGRDLALSPADLMATATALTAHSIERACRQFLPVFPRRFVVSGGGVHNRTLMKMLSELLSPVKVLPLEHFGLSSDAKEAFAFACLAYACILGQCNNLPSVTGAHHPVVMGKIQPGRNYIALMKKVWGL